MKNINKEFINNILNNLKSYNLIIYLNIIKF